MDDDLKSLETELKALRPAPVPRRLVTEVERELSPATVAAPARRTRVPLFWFWAALPAAAALAVALGVAMRRALPGPPPVAHPVVAAPDAREVLKPVAAENVLYSATDEGIVTL